MVSVLALSATVGATTFEMVILIGKEPAVAGMAQRSDEVNVTET
jgi:hypothetical protein